MSNTFPGGIHPPYQKEAVNGKAIANALLPKTVAISLSQHIGQPCEPVVGVGDLVKVGTLIAKSDKFVSASIYASVSGKVIRIEDRPHPSAGSFKSIIIESDGKDDKEPLVDDDIENVSAEDIVSRVKDAGIVGLGGACFPTHVKLSPPKEKNIDTFILNGAECEPRLCCDHRLMLERPKEILNGVLLIMKAINVKRGIIAIEDNKPDAIKAMNTALKSLPTMNHELRTVSLHTKYPQGGEKQLIKALVNREVPPNGLPFDVGCLVDNIATAMAIFEAVKFKKPLYERVITICGDVLKEPKNLLVRNGTSVKELLEQCGGLNGDLGKIVFGGPMMGISQYSLDTAVVKGTSGIMFVSKKESDLGEESQCIRCGKCVDACPVNLMPTTICSASKKSRYDIATESNATDCIECGSCAYVCPSKIPLVHYIKKVKNDILCHIVK